MLAPRARGLWFDPPTNLKYLNWKLIFKIPRCVPLAANLAHFVSKSDIHAVAIIRQLWWCGQANSVRAETQTDFGPCTWCRCHSQFSPCRLHGGQIWFNKVGHIGPKLDKFGTFSDQISVHFGSASQNVLKIWSEKAPGLSHLGPICPAL